MLRAGQRVITLAILIGAAAVYAQATGGLRVQVIDDSGTAIEKATVVLRHDAARLEPQYGTTDRFGEVEFPVLMAEGGWSLSVVIDDQRRLIQGVQVVLGRVTPVILQVRGEIETPPVTAPGGAVDVESIAAVTRFPEDFVRDLPIRGRFYQRVLPIAPGVDDADGDGNPRVHGATSRDFRAIVNGIANVDPATNQFMSFVNSDSIDQIAVIASGASLEFGRAQGGFAAITQKIGSNQLAVTGELRYRTSDLDGNGGSTDNTRDVEFRSVQPSVLVSGPIVKDKLWYRLAWERVNQEIPVDILNALEVQERDQTIQAYQLTWQASPRNRLALQYQSDPLTFSGFGIDSAMPLASSQRIDTESETLSLTWTVPWSSRLLVETTVAAQERSTSLAPEQTGVTNRCVAGEPFDLAPCTMHRGYVSGSHSRTVDASTDRLSIASRGTWHVGSLAGVANTLRFGVEIESDSIDRSLERGARSARFVIDPASSDIGVPEPIVLLPTSYSLDVSERGDVNATLWGIYVEDRIRPSRSLVVDFGLRVDREEMDLAGTSPFDPMAEADAFARGLAEGTTPVSELFRTIFTGHANLDQWASSLSGQIGIPPQQLIAILPNILRQSAFWSDKRRVDSISIRNTNVSPLVAASWDPWNDGRNKFTASARRYYGTLLPVVPLLDQEAATSQLTYGLQLQFGEPGWQYVVNGLSSNAQPTIDTTLVDHALETPYQDEWRLAYERELWRENRLRVEYVNRTYRDQLQVEEINRQTGDFGRCQVSSTADPRGLRPSPGSGFSLTDPFTGEVYVDTDPGDGDGRTDDCVGNGIIHPYLGTVLERPDGRPDPYIQNPAWGNVARINNDGERDYEAVVVDFVRRQFHGWGLQASYVWSRFEGSAEPFEAYVGIDRTRLENLAGAESNHQRHVVKVAANGVVRGDWRFGGLVTWGSGLPYSRVSHTLESAAVPPAYRGFGALRVATPRVIYAADERNSERNDAAWRMDVRVAKGFTFGDRARFEVALDVFNLLNDQPLEIYNPDTEMGLVVNGVAAARREFGRSFQLGLRIAY